MDRESISDSLLERLKARDPGAWERVVTLYTPLVFLWVRRARVQRDDEEDVVQDVMLSASGAIQRFFRDGPGTGFRRWLRVLTRHRVADYFERRTRTVRARGGTTANELLGALEGDAADFDDQEIALLYRQALELVADDIEARTLDVFRALTLEERPASEVATTFEMSVGAVYQARYRVTQRLKRELVGLLE